MNCSSSSRAETSSDEIDSIIKVDKKVGYKRKHCDDQRIEEDSDDQQLSFCRLSSKRLKILEEEFVEIREEVFRKTLLKTKESFKEANQLMKQLGQIYADKVDKKPQKEEN
jgi:hypothetical protein